MSHVSAVAPLMMLGNNINIMLGGGSQLDDFSSYLQQATSNTMALNPQSDDELAAVQTALEDGPSLNLQDDQSSAQWVGDIFGLTQAQSYTPDSVSFEQSLSSVVKDSASEAEAALPGGNIFPQTLNSDITPPSPEKPEVNNAFVSLTEAEDNPTELITQDDASPTEVLKQAALPAFASKSLQQERHVPNAIFKTPTPSELPNAKAVLANLPMSNKFTHTATQSTTNVHQSDGLLALKSVNTNQAMAPNPVQFNPMTNSTLKALNTHKIQTKFMTQSLAETAHQLDSSPTNVPWTDLNAQPATSTELQGRAATHIEIQTPVTDPQWQSTAAEKMHALIGQNVKQAEIQVHPDNLGPVHAKIHLDGNGQASIVFSSEHAAVRQALEGSVSMLRDLMQQDGMQLQQVDIQEHPKEQQTAGFQLGQGGAEQSSQHAFNQTGSEQGIGVRTEYSPVSGQVEPHPAGLSHHEGRVDFYA